MSIRHGLLALRAHRCHRHADRPPRAAAHLLAPHVSAQRLQEVGRGLAGATLRPGPVTVVATNTGSSEHDVVFSEGGAEIGRSHVLEPGEQQTLTIQATAGGPIRLECTVPGHAAAGMRASVLVAGR